MQHAFAWMWTGNVQDTAVTLKRNIFSWFSTAHKHESEPVSQLERQTQEQVQAPNQRHRALRNENQEPTHLQHNQTNLPDSDRNSSDHATRSLGFTARTRKTLITLERPPQSFNSQETKGPAEKKKKSIMYIMSK